VSLPDASPGHGVSWHRPESWDKVFPGELAGWRENLCGSSSKAHCRRSNRKGKTEDGIEDAPSTSDLQIGSADRVRSVCTARRTMARRTPITTRARTLPHNPHLAPLPRIGSIFPACQIPATERAGRRSLLAEHGHPNAPDLAKEVSLIRPAKDVHGTVSVLLTMTWQYVTFSSAVGCTRFTYTTRIRWLMS